MPTLSTLTLNSPLSLYSIPLVWATAFYPHNKRFGLVKDTIGWDNLNPRTNTQRALESKTLSKDVALRIQRLEGAHSNGNEILPLWIGAVLAGNFVGLPQSLLNKASVVYITTRLLYNYIYINQRSSGVSWFRTGVFFSSVSVPLYLFVQSANKLLESS